MPQQGGPLTDSHPALLPCTTLLLHCFTRSDCHSPGACRPQLHFNSLLNHTTSLVFRIQLPRRYLREIQYFLSSFSRSALARRRTSIQQTDYPRAWPVLAKPITATSLRHPRLKTRAEGGSRTPSHSPTCNTSKTPCSLTNSDAPPPVPSWSLARQECPAASD